MALKKDFVSPIVLELRAGTSEDPYIRKAETGKSLDSNAALPLEENPSANNDGYVIEDGQGNSAADTPVRVYAPEITGYDGNNDPIYGSSIYLIEIRDPEALIGDNEFRVDYSNGILYFSQERALDDNIEQIDYIGKGAYFISANRVYALYNEDYSITVTLEDYIETIGEGIEILTQEWFRGTISSNTSVDTLYSEGLSSGNYYIITTDVTISTSTGFWLLDPYGDVVASYSGHGTDQIVYVGADEVTENKQFQIIHLGEMPADQIIYENSGTSLSSTNVQNAITELDSNIQDLAGSGRTTETVKDNYDLITGTGGVNDRLDDLETDVGDLSTLTTDDKSNLVNAINEVDSNTNTNANDITELAGVGRTTETVKDNRDRIDSNTTNIGDLGSLTTDNKSTIVNAINEVDSHADANEQNIYDLAGPGRTTETVEDNRDRIDSLDTTTSDLQTQIGDLLNLTTDDKTNLVSAINEVDGNVDDLAGVGRVNETVKQNADNFSAHETDLNNPHQVTKDQVGLSNVPNVDTTNASNITTGTLPNNVLPPLAISETFVRNSEAQQLDLINQGAEEGDICIRTDESLNYIMLDTTTGTMADWQVLAVYPDQVLSVNGYTGTIQLVTGDINEGAGSGTTNLWYTESRVSSNIDVSLNSNHRGRTDNPHNVIADQVSYDNSGTNVNATDVQNAITELDSDLSNLAGSGRTTQTVKDNYDRIISNDGDISSIQSDIGNLSNLTTDDKSNLVNAINEVDGNVDDLAGAGRTTQTVKQNADDIALNTINISTNTDNIGNLNNLTTDNKTDLVSAINEVDANTDTNTAAIDDLAGVGRTTETVKDNRDRIDTNRTDIDNHVADYTNPHQVTAEQVDTYDKAYLDSEFAKNTTVLYGERFTLSNIQTSTFDYTNFDGDITVGAPKSGNTYSFILQNGYFIAGKNRLNVLINNDEVFTELDDDVVTVDAAVGTNTNEVDITYSFVNGDEIQFKYHQGNDVVYTYIDNDSVTNAKLAPDVKVGSLASLTTTNKDDVTSAINELDSDINALDSRVTIAESDIDALEGRMTTAESDIDALETRMTTAETDIDNLETRMTTAENDIDALEVRVDTVETDLDALEVDFSNHANGTGADHTYIDQDVTTTATPDFRGVQLTTIGTPTYQEGLTFYDNNTSALSYYNDVNMRGISIGQEIIIPIYNDTGSTLTAGTVVHPNGRSGARYTVNLALADELSTSLYVAVIREDISNLADGYAVLTGIINMNTSTYTEDAPLFLSDTNPGELTQTITGPGSYVTVIGTVLDSAVDGYIYVDLNHSRQTRETNVVHGLPYDMQYNTTMSFDDLTRTFTITDPSGEIRTYEEGDKYVLTSPATVTIPDLEGIHWIYSDDGVLTSINKPSYTQMENIFKTKTVISGLYWDSTNQEHIIDIIDARRGLIMDRDTLWQLYLAQGITYINGLAPGNINADADGNLDSSAQYSVSQGSYLAYDKTLTAAEYLVGDTIPVLYNANVEDLRTDSTTGFAVLTTGTGRLAWNEFNGSNWVVSEVGNNDFALYHLFYAASNTPQAVTVMGQATYGNISEARTGAYTEIGDLTSNILYQDFTPVATFIYQTSDSYGNTVKSRIRSTDEGDDYIDWRGYTTGGGSGGGSATGSHTTLIDRGAADQHPAGSITYTNTTSTLAATNVQDAVDELDTKVEANQAEWGNISGDINNQTDLQNEFVNADGDDVTGNLVLNNNIKLQGRNTISSIRDLAYVSASNNVILGDTISSTYLFSIGEPQWWNGSNSYELITAKGEQVIESWLKSNYKFTTNNTNSISLNLSNIEDRYYKVATFNGGASGLRLHGSITNHVQTNGVQNFDFTINPRLNNAENVSVDGDIYAGGSGTNVGWLIINNGTGGTWGEYDIYLCTSAYSQVYSNFEIAGSNAQVVYEFTESNYVTTEPTGTATELDTRNLSIGSYSIVNSVINRSARDASELSYDNATSGLTATDVQNAIDEVEARVDATEHADGISYDNATSGLAATNVQTAIDEVEARVDVNDAKRSYPLADENKLAGIESGATADQDADEVPYDNTSSGLAATNVQTAIDEVAGTAGGSATWGSIIGDINNQTDLQNEFVNTDGDEMTSHLSFVNNQGLLGRLTAGAGGGQIAMIRVNTGNQVRVGNEGYPTYLYTTSDTVVKVWGGGTIYDMITSRGGQEMGGHLTWNNNVGPQGKTTGGTPIALIRMNTGNQVRVGEAGYPLYLYTTSDNIIRTYDGTNIYEVITSKGGQTIDGNLTISSQTISPDFNATESGQFHLGAFNVAIVDVNDLLMATTSKNTVIQTNNIDNANLQDATNKYKIIHSGGGQTISGSHSITGNLTLSSNLFNTKLTTGNQQMINTDSNTVYVGNPASNLILETSSGGVFQYNEGGSTYNIITSKGGQSISGTLGATWFKPTSSVTEADLISSSTQGFSIDYRDDSPFSWATKVHFQQASSTSRGFQLAAEDTGSKFHIRNGNNTAWESWKEIITDAGGQSINGNLSVNQLNGYDIAGGSGNRWGNVVVIGASDGGMEIGKYIDFHNSDDSTSDYYARLIATAAHTIDIQGKGQIIHSGGGQTISGTLTTTDHVKSDALIQGHTGNSGFLPTLEGAYYHGSGTQTGAIQIRIPADANRNRTMMSFKVTLFNYSDNTSQTLFIHGYNFNDGVWHRTSAYALGGTNSGDYNVRFTYDTTYQYVYIGETTDSWDYLQVTVHDFNAGGTVDNGLESWADGWNVSLASSFQGTTSATINNTKYKPAAIVENYNTIEDVRDGGDYAPNNSKYARKITYEFTNGISSGNTWDSVITVQGWSSDYQAWQLFSNAGNSGDADKLFFRTGINSWNAIKEIITDTGGQTIGGTLTTTNTIAVEGATSGRIGIVAEGSTRDAVLRTSSDDAILGTQTSGTTTWNGYLIVGGSRFIYNNGSSTYNVITSQGGQTIDGTLETTSHLYTGGNIYASANIYLPNDDYLFGYETGGTPRTLIYMASNNKIAVGATTNAFQINSSTTPTYWNGSSTYSLLTTQGGQTVNNLTVQTLKVYSSANSRTEDVISVFSNGGVNGSNIAIGNTGGHLALTSGEALNKVIAGVGDTTNENISICADGSIILQPNLQSNSYSTTLGLNIGSDGTLKFNNQDVWSKNNLTFSYSSGTLTITTS